MWKLMSFNYRENNEVNGTICVRKDTSYNEEKSKFQNIICIIYMKFEYMQISIIYCL